MSKQPRLLYLGHNLPFPPDEGALIRSYNTVRLLSRSFDLQGLYFFRRGALTTPEQRQRALDAMESFGPAVSFHIMQEWSRVRLAFDHLRSVIGREPYTRWAYESDAFRRALIGLLQNEQFDIVHVDSIDLLAYLPLLEDLPTVLVHHNVESSLLARRAESEPLVRRAYLREQARLLRSAEQRWCERVDLNVAVSREDERSLRALAPEADIIVVPNGVDTTSFTPSNAEPRGDLVFVGGYSWFPNAEGMEFFAQEILPLIHQEEPSLGVKWIGKAPTEARKRFAGLGVEMLGYVDDIRPNLHDARCVIVPLRVGGGTRLKILDAWALGKAVVSTSLGCEGLEIHPGDNILVADDPSDFASKTLEVIRDASLRRTLEAGGRRTAVNSYDWDILGERMTNRYWKLLP